jgi:L1 cell adhesion molecule like protein
MTHWPFEVIEKDGSPLIKVQYLGDDKTFSPQEISSMVLTKMKEISEAKLGKTVKKAVVTLVFPRLFVHTYAYCTFAQRASLLQ